MSLKGKANSLNNFYQDSLEEYGIIKRNIDVENQSFGKIDMLNSSFNDLIDDNFHISSPDWSKSPKK